MYKLIFFLILFSCNSPEKEDKQASNQFRFKELYVQNNSGLHLRSEPKKNSSSLGLIKQNEIVTLLSYTNQMEEIEYKEGEWYKVKYKEIVGYMFSPYLDIFKVKTEPERTTKIAQFENYKIQFLNEEISEGKCYLEVYKNSKQICKKTVENCHTFYSKKDEFYLAEGFGDDGIGFQSSSFFNIDNCSEKLFKYSSQNRESYLNKKFEEYYIFEDIDYDKNTNKYNHKIQCDNKIIYNGDRLEYDSYEIKNCKIKFKKKKN